MRPVLSDLYRVTIPGGGSHYWKVLEIGPNGILWACLAIGRRPECMLTSYDDTIVEATDAALVGKTVRYEAFTLCD